MDLRRALLVVATAPELEALAARWGLGGALDAARALADGAPFAEAVAAVSDATILAAAARLGWPDDAPVAELRSRLATGEAGALTLTVAPRAPRLAWQGMHRREAGGVGPRRVVERHRPGGAAGPVGRLLLAADNLAALRALLDERDADGWRHRGKVDLVYIDPPFMVQDDFAGDVRLPEAGGRRARARPRTAVPAYTDTWPDGLDGFLGMLRERLLLIRELLAPTGNLVVHLDWHAAHYAKVLLDELFGYENFRNDIQWKRRSGFMGAGNRLGAVTDSLLFYGAGPDAWFSPITAPHAPEYTRRFKYVDARGRRYRLDNLSSPTPRPNLRYVYKGFPPPPNGWAVSRATMERMDAEGRVHVPADPAQRLQRRAFLDERPGAPVQSLWDDLPPVNPMALEALGYPTQKPVALLERILRIACPPGGLVLDAFVGSGTAAEAAARLGRRFVGIDHGRYAVHLTRRRLLAGEAPVAFDVEELGAVAPPAPLCVRVRVERAPGAVRLHLEHVGPAPGAPAAGDAAAAAWAAAGDGWAELIDGWAVAAERADGLAGEAVPVFTAQSWRVRRAHGPVAPAWVTERPDDGARRLRVRVYDVFGGEGSVQLDLP